MKRMSIAREIRIQRKQNKNRMTGKTFNPGGHTGESLDRRERELVAKCNAMTQAERKVMYDEYREWEQIKEEQRIFVSNTFEHNAFMRHFEREFTELQPIQLTN